jgi:hypothetical protein
MLVNNAVHMYFNRRFDAMRTIEEEIIDKLRTGPCRFDDVVNELPDFSWAEVFDAVDCMSRDGRISLRQHGFSTYQLSLGPLFAYTSSTA